MCLFTSCFKKKELLLVHISHAQAPLCVDAAPSVCHVLEIHRKIPHWSPTIKTNGFFSLDCAGLRPLRFPGYGINRSMALTSTVTTVPYTPETLLLQNEYSFFISIQTRNGHTGAPFILSTCDLLQVVAKTGEFCLIYDTWYFISYEKYEKRRFESMRF